MNIEDEFDCVLDNDVLDPPDQTVQEFADHVYSRLPPGQITRAECHQRIHRILMEVPALDAINDL